MQTDAKQLSRAFPIVVSGPSGVGKSSIVERLLRTDAALRLSVSMTTRAPRDGEVDGRDYFFVDTQEFRRRQDTGAFVECAEVHGQLYGTPRDELDAWLERDVDVLLDLDVQGGIAIMHAYASAVSIFILPPSFAMLEARLRARASDSEGQIVRRLEVAASEMAQATRYSHIVVNDDIDQTTQEILGIIAAERLRVDRIKPHALDRIIRPTTSTGCPDGSASREKG